MGQIRSPAAGAYRSGAGFIRRRRQGKRFEKMGQRLRSRAPEEPATVEDEVRWLEDEVRRVEEWDEAPGEAEGVPPSPEIPLFSEASGTNGSSG